MTHDEMEATLRLHGWQPGVTMMGNYVWVKTERELHYVAIGVDKIGRVFNGIGPFVLGAQPPVGALSFHNMFHKIMAHEKASA